MDEIYVTYVDDEHVDNHDYDDNTDDDHDNNTGICIHYNGDLWCNKSIRSRQIK